jgi:DNA (cytosine-5)-methyltransferase 1
MSNFKFIDLFAGIGGFRIALDKLGGTCVFSSEIDEECKKTYLANFGEMPHGDITKINSYSIPDHDILCAGFPCQPFSICGLKKGFEDTRGTLFFNVMEIIANKRPKAVLLENVKHLLHHDQGKTLKTIIKSLQSEGYFVNWKILNAKDFGLAQNRERIIIIGTLDQNFDFKQINNKAPKKIKDILEAKQGFDFLKPSEYSILDRKLWKLQGSGLIFCGYRNKSIRKVGVRENTEHLSRVHKQPNRIYHVNGTHPTLPSQEVSGRFFIYDNENVRKLSINECFRLQGFPDSFKKISSTGNLYKQIGNSVAVPMIEDIAHILINKYLKISKENNNFASSVINIDEYQYSQLQLF